MLADLIQVDRMASVFVAQPLLSFGLLRTTPGIPILMYHSVSDDPEPWISPYYRVTTSPARFREHMRWLRESGYSVIDLAEALAQLSTGKFEEKRTVVLTFDDGFRDFLTAAWPVLEEYGYSATMFLPTAFIAASRKSFKGRECLTWDEVRDLRARGARFGAHTVNHPILYDLPWPQITQELRDARLHIEGELDERIDTFAYPYAFPQQDREFASRLRAELHEQGYVAAVTTVIGRAGQVSDPLCLKRLPVNQADDRALFLSKLAGAYDWVGSLQAIARRTKASARTVRPS